MLYYETDLRKKGFDLIIGVDEAGRGPLAGPVVAAAAALLAGEFENRIDDSKKLSPLQRERAFHEIQDKCITGIGVVSETVVDSLNILQAARVAMEIAVTSLLEKARKRSITGKVHLLVDGIMRLRLEYPMQDIIKGDQKSKSIACASIVAKVTRDRLMQVYDQVYPQYGFSRHKGYPTASHREAILKYGPAPVHRKTFL